MTTLAEISKALSEPFAADEIGFLPKGKVEREGKTLCMALPYADPRVYEDRLNALAPGEWSTPQPVALTVGNKLICYVTVIVCGVAHTDVGEADPGENQGTEAWAQAFKRSCSQFGLGRYLYDLEKEWVPFNPQKKQIDLDKAGQRAIVRKMYQKAGITVQGEAVQKAQNGHQNAQTSSHPSANGKTPSAPPQREEVEVASPAPDAVPTPGQLRASFKALQLDKKGTFEQFVKAKLGQHLNDEALNQTHCRALSKRLDEVEKATTGAGGGH